MDFCELTGRRFKVIYKNLDDVMYNVSLKEALRSCHTIEGILENFNPCTNVVINSEKHGFNIISYETIIQMIEIKNNKINESNIN